MRYVLDGIEVDAGLGNLHGARVPAAAVERVAARIAHLGPVDVDLVIVQAWHQWGRRDSPESVGLLFHVDLGAAPEIELYLVGFRRLDANLNAAAGVHAWILRAPDIGLRGLEIARLLRACHARDQRERPNCVFHRITPSLLTTS